MKRVQYSQFPAASTTSQDKQPKTPCFSSVEAPQKPTVVTSTVFAPVVTMMVIFIMALLGLFLLLPMKSDAQAIPPMLKNGAPQAFVQFSEPKVNQALALVPIPGAEYREQIAMGKRGVLPTDGSSTQAMGFQLARSEIVNASGDFYVAVIYMDRGQGAIEIEYVQSTFGNTTVETDRVFLGNSGRWLRHIFPIKNAEFSKGFSGDADFRLSNAGIPIHRVGVSKVPPGDVGGIMSRDYQQRPYSLPPDITAAIVGEPGISATQWEDPELWRAKSELYGSWGIEHFIETVFAGRASDDGRTYDSSEYTEHADMLSSTGLSWSPRIKVGHLGHLSLEMSQTVQLAQSTTGTRNGPMLSMWDAAMPRLYERFLTDLGRRVRGNVPFVVLSFAGDWGALNLSSEVTGSQGNPGFWTGDPLAQASFQEFLRQRYGRVDTVSRVWGERVQSWQDIEADFMPSDPPAKALDFMDWYEASMTELIERLVAHARSTFPRSRIVIELSDEGRFSACDPIAIADIARQNSAAIVMISREAVPAQSTQWNRLGLAATTRGVSIGLRRDPASSRRDMNALLFSLASQQGTILLLQERDLSSGNSWNEYKAFWKQWRNQAPSTQVAVVYPRTQMSFETMLDYETRINTWRESFAFDIVDEQNLGALSASQYPVLIVPSANVWSAAALQAMEDYTISGGMLLAWTDEPWQSIMGDLDANERLFAVRLREDGGEWRLEPRRQLDERFTNRVSSNPTRTIVNVGSSGDTAFLYGRWGAPVQRETADSLGLPFDSFRWLGERGRITMPAIPRRNYTLHIEGYLPAGYPVRLFIDKKFIGTIEGGGVFNYSVDLTSQWRPTKNEVEIQLRGQSWMTASQLNMEQNYPVSIGISRVGLMPIGESMDADRVDTNAIASGSPFRIDPEALRTLPIRELGRGVTVLATSEQMNELTFDRIVMAILHNPKAIDPGFSFTLPPDRPGNNVFVTPMQGTTLFFNQANRIARLEGATQRQGRTIPARGLMYSR